MMMNREIKVTGLQILTKSLGLVEAERLVALIQQEPFDYKKAERQGHKARGFNPGSEASGISALKGRGQLNG